MGIEKSYLMILNNQGNHIKYRKVGVPYFDFKKQPNGLITNNRIIASYIPQGWGWAIAMMEVMDENLNLIDTVQCASYYITDFNEFKMLANGHYLLLSYSPTTSRYELGHSRWRSKSCSSRFNRARIG